MALCKEEHYHFAEVSKMIRIASTVRKFRTDEIGIQ